MKTMKLKLWLIATILLCLPAAIKANIQHTVTFSADELTIKNDTIDGLEFSSVNYGDLSNSGNPGDPSLPVKYLTFSVPYDAYNISVSATCGNAQEIGVPMWLVPEQEPQIISAPKNPFTDPNLDIYDIDSYFPANIATISNEGFLHGDNHLITVAIRPVQFNGARNLVKLNKSISISISYISGNGIGQMAMKPILKYVDNNRTETLQQVTDMVANPNSVEAFRGPLAIQPRTVEPMPYYQYCVITSRELAPAFKRLIELKKHKGYDAGVVCMEDILACPEYQDGDVVSGINDDAGKLRAYLTDAYRYGTRYVLLGGKEPHVPIRYATSNLGKELDDEINNKVPTDMYFRDLNSHWDYNCNQIVGEKEDKIDIYYDLSVGRLLCKEVSEIQNYINKLIKYELNPGNGSVEFSGRALFVYSAEFADKSSPSSTFRFYPDSSRMEIYAPIDYVKGSEIISHINNEKPVYISAFGHGNPAGILLGSTGLNALDDEYYYHKPELNNGLDCLTNFDTPAIMVAKSCTTMPFDIYENIDTVYRTTFNVGESFTVGGKYGGVVYIGNTRVTDETDAYFLEDCLICQLKESNTIIGELFNATHGTFPSCKWQSRIANNILGDPAIDLWTVGTISLKNTEFSILRNANGISVSSQYLNGCTVVACTPNGFCISKRATTNSVSFTNVSPNSHIVIYRHNMLPYLAPIQIQDEIINNSLHYFADVVNIGTFAYPDRESGNVILDSNADVVIEALGDVTLGPGLILNSGASLAIKTPGKVAIDGCIINNGATIKIEALETEITNEFNAQKGAVIEISKMSN